jgi:hypothetical protein
VVQRDPGRSPGGLGWDQEGEGGQAQKREKPKFASVLGALAGDWGLLVPVDTCRVLPLSLQHWHATMLF